MVDYEAESIAQMRQELPLHEDHSTTAKDYTGLYHTTLNRLAALTNISVGGNASIFLDTMLGGTGRYKQTVLKVVFKDAGDYIEIDLTTAEDWTAGNAEDDDLTFFMYAIAAFANDQFDLELRDNAGNLITSADYTVPALAAGHKPQFVSIDTSGETLTAVRYIRIVYDGSTEKTLYLWDFVRCLATALTKALIVDVEAAHENVAGAAKFNCTSDTGTDGHIHRNSLANDPETITIGQDELITGERIGWFIFHGIGTDTTVDLEAATYSR